MLWLSYIVIVVQPLTACLLAFLVLHYRERLFGLWIVRFWLALLSIGLFMHAAGHIVLISEYREPRTLSWMPLFFSVDALIWSLGYHHLRTHRKRKHDGLAT